MTGIDQCVDVPRIVPIRNVHDQDALRHPHLGRGQADSLGVVHRVEHVPDEPAGLVRHGLHRRCRLPQDLRPQDLDLADRQLPYSASILRATCPRSTTMRVFSPVLIVSAWSVAWTITPRMPPFVMTWSPRDSLPSICW